MKIIVENAEGERSFVKYDLYIFNRKEKQLAD